MVIKIIENSVKNLGLPLLVFDNFDTSFVDCQSGKIILAFFDDSIPNITGIPPLEYEKILIYRKSSQPLKGFNHYIKKPFLPTEILSFIKPKIPQDLQSSASPSSLNLGAPSIAIPTTQASAELAAIAQSLDSELLEPSSPTPAKNLEENLATEPKELKAQEDLQEESSAIPALKATLDDENFIDLPDINSFEDLDNFVAQEMQDFTPQAEPSAQTTESTPTAPLQDTPSQDTYNESELLDFDAVFDKKDDAKIALDEVDTDDFLKDFDLDDLHERGEEPKHTQAMQPEQDLQDSLDSTQPTQILNPKDIDEIKRLLQETAIAEPEEFPSTQTHRADPLHTEPTYTESTAPHVLDSAIAQANAMASSSLASSPAPSDVPNDDNNTADFTSPTPMEASLQTSLQNPMQAPQAEDALPAPRSIREHLDEDFVSALKDIEGDIESLSIDEGEILEALNQNALQNAKNLQTPSTPQAQSLSCSGAEFIELIKNTPSEELQKLFGSSKILLEIDFNKQ